jgi:hypothetical protein
VPCRSISDEKSKTIPVPGGRFYLHFEFKSQLWSPAISVLIGRKIQHTQIGSIPVVLPVAFSMKKCYFSWTWIFL